MMILMRLCLILSLSAAAPLNSNMDKQDLVNDDIASVDTVNGDDTGSDGLRSHTSHNTNVDKKDLVNDDIASVDTVNGDDTGSDGLRSHISHNTKRIGRLVNADDMVNDGSRSHTSLNTNVDKNDLVNDDIASDTVNGDDTGSDGLHSHTSHNTKRIGRLVDADDMVNDGSRSHTSLNTNMDKKDLVNDDVESVDTVNGDDTDNDGLHSHTSHNTKRTGRLVNADDMVNDGSRSHTSLNTNVDKKDLVNDDIASVDTVNGDDTDISHITKRIGRLYNNDGSRSHTSVNTKKFDRLAFYGGSVSFSGSLISTGLANINIASMISNHKFQDLQNGQSPITQVCTVHTVGLESCFCPDETSGGSLCEAGEKCNEDGTCQLGSSCEDKFERCTHWIELSECDEWMEKNCQKTCNACPVIDGGWSGWSDYSACSATCGDASHKRTRTCSDPAPANGGKSCSGWSQQTSDCDLPFCVPIDCSLSAWSEWTECSSSCGGGIQRRHRHALREAKHDGKKCQDIELSQKQPCLKIECPPIIDGVWSGWSEYSVCSATCGAESQKRTRTCSDPAPANGGKSCSGWSQQTRDCNLPLCGKKRKRSVPEFVNVRGKIILPTGLDFTFPEDSSVYVSCDDISNLQSTNLGSAVVDVSNKSSKKEIIYELEADLANSGDISMSATVHVGWKRGQNGEEWIRKGDFFNDISHSLDVVEGTSQYQLDIAVVLLD